MTCTWLVPVSLVLESAAARIQFSKLLVVLRSFIISTDFVVVVFDSHSLISFGPRGKMRRPFLSLRPVVRVPYPVAGYPVICARLSEISLSMVSLISKKVDVSSSSASAYRLLVLAPMVKSNYALSGASDVMAARSAPGCINASEVGKPSAFRVFGSKMELRSKAALLASRSKASTHWLLNLMMYVRKFLAE